MSDVGCFCTYCGIVADTVDHVVPQWLLRRAGALNMDLSAVFRLQRWEVPACRECNSSLGNRIFPTLKERRAAAHAHIRRKYRSYINMPNWSEEEIAEMGPNAQVDIRKGLVIRDWARDRLRWNGAKEVEAIETIFGLAKAVARAEVDNGGKGAA